jgi:hypothetical protein
VIREERERCEDMSVDFYREREVDAQMEGKGGEEKGRG